MEPSIAQYIGFIVLVVIMGVLAMALNRRIEKRRMTDEQASRGAGWVKLDVQQESADDLLPSPEPESEPDDEHAEENDGQNMHARAKQNGHFSESKKPG